MVPPLLPGAKPPPPDAPDLPSTGAPYPPPPPPPPEQEIVPPLYAKLDVPPGLPRSILANTAVAPPAPITTG